MGPFLPFTLKIDPTKTRLWKELKLGSPLIACRYDPTGKYLFATAQDSSIQRVNVLDASTTKLSGHQGWVRSMAFSKKDHLLVSADYHGVINLWNWQQPTPKPSNTIEAHDGWIRALAISSDGQTLASCGNDLKVKVWSLPDGRLLKTLEGHDYHVYNLAFHTKEDRLVSADLKGKIIDWNWHQASIIRELDAKVLHKYDKGFMADIGGVRCIAFNNAGTLLACGGITNVSNAFAGVGNPQVVLFDWSTGKIKQQLVPAVAFQGTAWGVAFHPDGFIVGAGGGNGGQIWYWKPDQPNSFHTVSHGVSFRDMTLHPQGAQLGVACSDGVLRQYSLLALVSKIKA
ncbi:MAG TPA: hypothetical protein PLN21_01625 [Gemmatales bacterium]|nr:hypothetical protein [Gemmatales bacterium]